MNFLGLGFNFGSQDKGLAKSIKTTSSGLADISKSVIGIGAASAKMAFKPPNMGKAVNQFMSLASDVKLTTTQLEAFGVQANKASSAGLAGLNKTSSEMKRLKSLASSTAFSMNTDTGAVVSSMTALEQAGYDTTKAFAGFKNFKEFQKVMEVTGADSTTTAAAMGRLEKQYGFSSKKVGDLMKNTLALGKRMNIGREAMQSFGETVNFLGDNAQALGDDFKQADMERYVLGTTKMTGALVAAGASAKDAQQSVQKMNEMLLGGQRGMKAIFSGLENDFGDSSKALIEHFGGVDKMFELMKSSPDEFAGKMATAMEDVRRVTGDDDVFNRFRLQMEGTFGKGMMSGVDKGGKAMQDALAKANKPLGNTESALSDTAKAYHDGRTAAERFAIAQDRLITRMKTIQGVMSDQEYLKKYKTNTDQLYQTLKKTAEKGGPMGKMTTMLIEMRTKGIGGALAAHSKWGLAIAEMGNQFGPILKALPGIAAAFMALASPIGIVAAAIGGLFFVFKDLEKGDKSIVRPWIEKLKKEAPKILEAVKNAFTKALSVIGRVVTWVVEKIDFNKVGQVLGQVLSKAAELSLTIFRAAFRLGEKLLIWLGNLPWGDIGKKIGYYLAAAFEIALKAVVRVVSKLPQILVTAVSKAVDLVIGLLDGIRDFLVKKFPQAAKPIVFVFEMLKALVRIIGWTLKTAVKVVGAVFKAAWGAIKGIIQGIVWVVEKLVGGIKAIGSAISKVGGWVKSGISKVGGFFSSIGGGIKSLFSGGGGISSMVEKAMKKAKEDAKKESVDLQKIMEEARKKAQEKLDKATANSIKNINEITGKTSEGVKKQFDALLASGKKVVTIEGNVIKASDAVTQYVHTASGEIKKQVMEANKLRFAQIDNESFKEAKDQYWKLRKEGQDLLKNENYSSEKYDEYWKRRQDAVKAFRDQHGVDMAAVAHAGKFIEEQMALNKDLFKGVEGAAKSYTAALIANQDQLATNAAEQFLEITKARDAGKISHEEASKQYKALEKQISDSRQMAKDIIPIIKGDFDALMSGIKGGSKEAQVEAARIAKVYTANWRASVEDVLKNIPQASKAARDEISSTYDDLTKSYEIAMKDILAKQWDSNAERKKAIDDLNSKFKKAQDDLTKTLKDNNKALVVGATEDTLAAVSEIKAGFKTMTDETKIKTAEAAGEIQKTMGVSADEAARMVGTISNLKPRQFKNNMAIIKGEFKKFLEAVTSEAKGMMDKGAEYINTFWKTAKEGWNQQTLLVKQWADESKIHIQRYWTDVLTAAGKALTGFLGLANQVRAQLQLTASSFNIMNLLASPSDISNWARMVVGSLVAAIRGGGVGVAMAQAYADALSSGAALPAAPDSDASGASANRRAASDPRGMKEAINNPYWVNNPNVMINREIVALRAEMGKLADALLEMSKKEPNNPRGSKGPKEPRN